MSDLNKKIEAILFSVGDKISLEEISKLTKEKDIELIRKTLRELREKYVKSDSPIILHEEREFWKMNVKEEHMTTVRKVVKKMELSKTLLETLAIIAWKSPVLQSKVIHVRTNKAYDHLDELEKMGYITRKKQGRTKLITLTQKFYDYFEINKKGGLDKIFKKVTEKAKKKFGEKFDIIEEAPENDEESDKKLEIVEEIPETSIIDETQTGEKLDNLEIYEEKPDVEIIEDENVPSKMP